MTINVNWLITQHSWVFLLLNSFEKHRYADYKLVTFVCFFFQTWASIFNFAVLFILLRDEFTYKQIGSYCFVRCELHIIISLGFFQYLGQYLTEINKAFRHVETLFVQGNQVRTDQNKPTFLLIKKMICFHQYELGYHGRIKFLHVEMPYWDLHVNDFAIKCI